MNRPTASLLLLSLLSACATSPASTPPSSQPLEIQTNLSAFEEPSAVSVSLQGPFASADAFCGTHALATPDRGEATSCRLKPLLGHDDLTAHGLLLARADGTSTVHAAFEHDGLLLVTDPLIVTGTAWGYSFTGTLHATLDERTKRIELTTVQGAVPSERNPNPHVTKTRLECDQPSPEMRCTFEPQDFDGARVTTDFNRLVDNLCSCGSESACTQATWGDALALGDEYWDGMVTGPEYEAAMSRLSMCQPEIFEGMMATTE